ncbi:MAG TPA: PRC-barrel domain-containing protein [Geminicoccaceae bacterium]|nr:PRC-barrel domain-containing protein [Geminicoccaceae bacterium]
MLALAVPAAAEDQAKPDDTAAPKLEQAQKTLENEQAGKADQAAMPAATEDQAAPQTTVPEQPGVTAEGEQPPAAGEEPVEEMAEEQPLGEPEQDLAEEEEATPPPDMTFIEVQDAAQFLANDEVIGKEVFNVMDEEVGTIADLVMDQDQKLVGVVLSVGGFLGIGDKWVAIPVDQIDFPTDEQPARLLVAVTEEQLKNAPDFVTRDVV